MSKNNVANEKNVEMSFLEKLSKALKNDGSKVSAQYLCSAPRIVPTTGDKGYREQLVATKA